MFTRCKNKLTKTPMKCLNLNRSTSRLSVLALFTVACWLTIASPLRAQSPPGANLQLWLEGNAGVTTNVAGNVTAWTDQSPNGYVAMPPGGANPPVYLPSVAALSNM